MPATNGGESGYSASASVSAGTLPPNVAYTSPDKVQRTGSFGGSPASTEKIDKDSKKRHSVFGGLFKKDKKDKKKDKH